MSNLKNDTVKTKELYKDYLQGKKQKVERIDASINKTEKAIQEVKNIIRTEKTLYDRPTPGRLKDLDALKKQRKQLLHNKALEEEGLINQTTYSNIIQDFCILVMRKMIKGGRFNVPRLGVFVIKRLKRNKPVPDWGRSNKKKQEIIDRGGVPAEFENGKNINGGEEWLFYYTDSFYCKFYWEKLYCTIPFSRAYSYDPPGINKAGTSPKQLLRDHIKEHGLLSYPLVLSRQQNGKTT